MSPKIVNIVKQLYYSPKAQIVSLSIARAIPQIFLIDIDNMSCHQRIKEVI